MNRLRASGPVGLLMNLAGRSVQELCALTSSVICVFISVHLWLQVVLGGECRCVPLVAAPQRS